MKESKLIELLESLSVEELKAFGTYLEKANHSKSSNVYKLYNYLKKYHPDYPEKKIEKQVVFKKIMPKGKAFNDKALRSLMSQITLVLEEFLLKIEFDKDEVERDFMMLRVLKKRKKDKLFFQKITQIERKWQKKPTPGVEHYHNEYRLLKTYHSHPYTKLIKDEKVSLVDLVYKIDEYYFATKLYYAVCMMQQVIGANNTTLDKNVLIGGIYELIKNKETVTNLHIDVFKHFYEAYSQNKFKDYFALKSLYFDEIKRYSSEEQHDLFIFLEKHCYENYKEGKEGFLKEIFELNKFAVEQGFLKANDSIATDVFRNIVQVACALKEFDWASQFITEHKLYLEEDKRADIVALCEAVLLFHQGLFEQTLDKLLLVKYQDPLYAILARCLQLQSYYELPEYDELFYNLVNSFTVFISRDTKLPESIKKATLNFVQFTHKLYKFKYVKAHGLSKLIKDLEDCSLLVNKKWLLQKGTELLLKKKQLSG